MNRKARIAVLAGGFSGESQVSMKSSETIMANLDPEFFESYLVKVQHGEWLVVDGDIERAMDLNTFTFQGNELVKFDYAYIIIHGEPGENGKLQGYLDMMGIPHSTGSVFNMALTFNKARTQRLMLQEGITIADHMIFKKEDRPSDRELVDQLGLPFFVKPTESGSSIGISKVKSQDDVAAAIDLGFDIHNEIIVESMLKGRELACGVYRIGNEVIALPITEISSEREFFDYEAKYEDETTSEVTPAPIPHHSYERCQELSRRIYALTDCKGIARADFFLCGEELFFVEINTVPGMSKESLVPQQFDAAEVELRAVLTQMISSDLSIKSE